MTSQGADMEYIKALEEIMKQSLAKPSECMHPECTNIAINSHLHQKATVLRQIAPKNHLYCFNPTSYFCENPIRYVKKGINESMSFYGFCKKHDDSIFRSIEKGTVDWHETSSQYLLAYKSVCKELDIRRRVLSFCEGVIETIVMPIPNYCQMVKKRNDCELAIKDLERYKSMIENGVFNNDYSTYSFKTIELPICVELCVSSQFSVSYSFIPNQDIQEADLPECNIVNIFPDKGKTIIILGFLNGFENKWLIEFERKISSEDYRIISKALSDLVLFRASINCISESVYNSIEESELIQFYQEWMLNSHNFSERLSSDVNIFKNFVTDIVNNHNSHTA